MGRSQAWGKEGLHSERAARCACLPDAVSVPAMSRSSLSFNQRRCGWVEKAGGHEGGEIRA